MPKRVAEDIPSGSLSRQDSGLGVKSRSGRVVKPKIYNDYDPLDDNHSKDATDEHLHTTQSDDDDSRGTSSDVSFGSRGQRTSSQPSRPARRTIHSSSLHRQPRSGGGGGIFKAAAVEVLRQERRLMSTGEIARAAITRGLVVCTGKTPEATMASALYTDVKRKEEFSIFIRPSEGLFGLREWIDQGVSFIDVATVKRGGGVTTTSNTRPPRSTHHHHYNTSNHNDDDEDDEDGEDGDEQLNDRYESVDRLMELLDAAEEINKTHTTNDDDDMNSNESDKENEKEDNNTKNIIINTNNNHHAGVCHPHNNNNTITNEYNTTTTTTTTMEMAKTPRPSHTTTTTTTTNIVAEEAIKAAEAAVHRLTQQYGQGHPQVNQGYLTLARLYTFDLPSPSRQLAESAVTQAQESISRVQETAALHSTATNAALSACKTDDNDSSFTTIMQKLQDEAAVDAVTSHERLHAVHAALIHAVKSIRTMPPPPSSTKDTTTTMTTTTTDVLVSPIQTSAGVVSSGGELTPFLLNCGSAVQTSVVVAGSGN